MDPATGEHGDEWLRQAELAEGAGLGSRCGEGGVERAVELGDDRSGSGRTVGG